MLTSLIQERMPDAATALKARVAAIVVQVLTFVPLALALALLFGIVYGLAAAAIVTALSGPLMHRHYARLFPAAARDAGGIVTAPPGAAFPVLLDGSLWIPREVAERLQADAAARLASGGPGAPVSITVTAADPFTRAPSQSVQEIRARTQRGAPRP